MKADAFISREIFEEYKRLYPYPEKGDVLISAVGSVGRTAEYTGEDAYFQDSNVVWLKTDNSIDKKYLKVFYQVIRWLIEGSTVKHLYNDNILKSEIISPTLFDEQRKIGKFFDDLDHLITLHQRKYLQKKKTSLTWEQRKWIDSVDISTEMVDPTSSEYADMPHIAPGNIESFTGRILDNVKTVKEEQLISGKFRFRPDDVVYGKINPQLGKYFYASVDGLTSADAYVFKGKNGTTQKFLFSLLQTNEFFKYSVSVSKRSGMPKINRDELNAYRFFSPNKEEQDKIGVLLLGIDHLITLHRRAHFHRRRRTYK